MQSSTCKWQFTRKHVESNSPSRKDGISLKLEKATRRLALAFCQDVGYSLKMNQYTIATAMTYWQRFFTAQSHAKNDAYLVAAACLLLAGKVEENFKSLLKITETAYYTRHKKDPAAAERIKKDNKLLGSEMEKVTKAEEVLLVTLDFDFSTSHPHGPLCKLIKELGLHAKDRVKERFCQIAWNFSNDSLKTTLCLQPLSSTDIAVACINLAATTVSYELPTVGGKPWWSRFGTSKETLMDIERQIMSMYRRKDGESSMTSAASGLSVPPTPALAVGGAPLVRGTPSPNPIGKVELPSSTQQGSGVQGSVVHGSGVYGSGASSNKEIDDSRQGLPLKRPAGELVEDSGQASGGQTHIDSQAESGKRRNVLVGEYKHTNVNGNSSIHSKQQQQQADKEVQTQEEETVPDIHGSRIDIHGSRMAPALEVVEEQEEVEMEVDEPEEPVLTEHTNDLRNNFETSSSQAPDSTDRRGINTDGQAVVRGTGFGPSSDTNTGNTVATTENGRGGKAYLDLDEDLLTELEDVVAPGGGANNASKLSQRPLMSQG